MPAASDPQVAAMLDGLVPPAGERPDWARVLREAAPLGRRRRRPLILALAALVVVAVPLAALAATQGWWFFESARAPASVTQVSVVGNGRWDGVDWTLSAYRSSTDGICFAVTPGGRANARGVGAAMSCDSITGVPLGPTARGRARHPISYLLGRGGVLPPYVAGPVVASARSVEIVFSDGRTRRVPTIPAPSELGARVRFYVTRLPRGEAAPTTLVARGAGGAVVATQAARTGAAIPAHAFERVGNRGRLVRLPAWLVHELRAAHRSTRIYLLGTRDGRSFYRPGGRHVSRGVAHVCYGTGKPISPSAIPRGRRSLGMLMGSIGCEVKSPHSFPSLARPVWDLSVYGASRRHPQIHLLRLEGIASDAVRSVALVDAHRRVVRRVPVVDNLYSLSRVPDGVVWVEPSDLDGRPLAVCGTRRGAVANGSYLNAHC